jgi:AcrR family transcriptional regulator
MPCGVADVAAVCGVSETTVYNYFTTTESLLLDRWDAPTASLRTAWPTPALRRCRPRWCYWPTSCAA